MNNFIIEKTKSNWTFAILMFAFSLIGFIGFILGIICFKQYWVNALMFLIFPVICIPYGIYYLKEIKLPNELIIVESEKKLIKLYNDRKINFNEIQDIIYKQSNSKWGTYNFGKITIILKSNEKIVIKSVANVVENGNKLTRIIYGGKI